MGQSRGTWGVLSFLGATAVLSVLVAKTDRASTADRRSNDSAPRGPPPGLPPHTQEGEARAPPTAPAAASRAPPPSPAGAHDAPAGAGRPAPAAAREALLRLLREGSYEELARARGVPLPPNAAERDAVTGPRRCYGVDCYVAEVAIGAAADGQPVVYIIFMGLPASAMSAGHGWVRPPGAEGPHAAFMLDSRSRTIVRIDGRQVRERSSTQFRALARPSAARPADARPSQLCHIVMHSKFGGTNAHWEATTWRCRLQGPVQLPAAVELQARGSRDSEWRTLTAAPFAVGGGGSGGVMSAARRPPTRPGDSRVSACISGVDYWNPHPREIVQYYHLLGLQHIYLGLPAFHGDPWRVHVLKQLRDFLEEGAASVVVSAYTDCMVFDIGQSRLYHSPGQAEGEGPRKCFRFRPTGHMTAFNNACLLHARRHGDAWTIVGDFDDVIVPSPPPAVPEMRIDKLIELIARHHGFQDPERDLCAINMRLWDMWGPGHGHPGVGPSLADRWPYAMESLHADASNRQAAGLYGKSIHNAQRVLRVGLHMPAHCEGADEAQLEMQPWAPDDAQRWEQERHAGSPRILVARSTLQHIGSMHYLNMFATRGYQREMQRALRDPGSEQPGTYARLWIPRVREALAERQRRTGIEPWPAEAVRREAARSAR